MAPNGPIAGMPLAAANPVNVKLLGQDFIIIRRGVRYIRPKVLNGDPNAGTNLTRHTEL